MRTRMDYAPRIAALAIAFPFGPGDTVMQRTMLKGIRDRVESRLPWLSRPRDRRPRAHLADVAFRELEVSPGYATSATALTVGGPAARPQLRAFGRYRCRSRNSRTTER